MLFTASGAFAQARPDFSGTWMLDPAPAAPPGGAHGGRGAGLNPPRQLTFRQEANTLTMSWTQEGTTTTETLNLNGSESKTQMRGVTNATWEDNRIVIVTRQSFGGN